MGLNGILMSSKLGVGLSDVVIQRTQWVVGVSVWVEV